MTLFKVDFWNGLFPLPLKTRAHIPSLVWSCVLCVCRFVFCSGSLDIIGGTHYWLLVTMSLINIVFVWFDTFVCTLIGTTPPLKCHADWIRNMATETRLTTQPRRSGPRMTAMTQEEWRGFGGETPWESSDCAQRQGGRRPEEEVVERLEISLLNIILRIPLAKLFAVSVHFSVGFLSTYILLSFNLTCYPYDTILSPLYHGAIPCNISF